MDRGAQQVIEAVGRVLAEGGRGALATVVRTHGSAPQVVGARLFLPEDGRLVGTVGGGRIEAVVLEALASCMDDGATRTLRWDLSKQLGMCCGGRMEVLIEPVDGGPRLWIFGAGHVGRATAGLAADAGFFVQVVDERETWLDTLTLPERQRHACTPDEALREAGDTSRDYLLIATHDHQLDALALHAALARPHRYVGMVASQRKTLRIVRRLSERHGPQPLERLFSPVGLDIGATSPAQIAVAIVAELLAVKHGKETAHLRARLPDAGRARREPEGGIP